MDFFSNLFFKRNPVSLQECNSNLEAKDNDRGEVVLETLMEFYHEDVSSKECRVRRNIKWLTTCNQCGHYRFAKRNSKRIVNPNYPYEHSAKGGCTVSVENYIAPGKKLRRCCYCSHCQTAMEKFVHVVPGEKKLHQFSYKRSLDQKLMWQNMKDVGWRCRHGRYYRPGHYKEEEGLTGDAAFELYVSLCTWYNAQ